MLVQMSPLCWGLERKKKKASSAHTDVWGTSKRNCTLIIFKRMQKYACQKNVNRLQDLAACRCVFLSVAWICQVGHNVRYVTSLRYIRPTQLNLIYHFASPLLPSFFPPVSFSPLPPAFVSPEKLYLVLVKYSCLSHSAGTMNHTSKITGRATLRGGDVKWI